jgi:hypothetical protein
MVELIVEDVVFLLLFCLAALGLGLLVEIVYD